MRPQSSTNHNCNFCDEPIVRKPFQIKKGIKLFCNHTCELAYRKKQAKTIEERFWSRVEKRGPNECWPNSWAPGSNGRGMFTMIHGTTIYASRAAWIMTHGPIPNGLCVLHTCDNGWCTNPKHLYLGTKGRNNTDRKERGRNYNQKGERSHCAKLTEAQVRQIRNLWNEGKLTQFQIARQFDMSRSAIEDIVLRKTWVHID